MQPFRCPKCRVATSRDKDFCIRCGEALTIACDGCGKHWRYYQGYKFCPACGSVVSHPSAQLEVGGKKEERKYKKER